MATIEQTEATPWLNDKLAELERWYENWLTATNTNRTQQSTDAAYYDGDQWTEEEKSNLKDRGQSPITINRIKKKIDFLVGSAIQNRTDPRAMPRTGKHDLDATVCTDGIRYVLDDNDFDHRVDTRAAKNGYVWGIYGAVVEPEVVQERIPVDQQQQVGPDGETVAGMSAEAIVDRIKIMVRWVPARYIWHDPRSNRADLEDCKYKGTIEYGDRRDVISNYSARPDAVPSERLEAITESTTRRQDDSGETGDDTPASMAEDDKRERTQVKVCYWHEPASKELLEALSEYLPGQVVAKVTPGKTVWMVAHYTNGGFLVLPRPTMLFDDMGEHVCGLVLGSGYVTDGSADTAGLRYGLVRNMRGPQDEINQGRSKAIHLGSTRQFAYEEGAFPNPDTASHEMTRPDGQIKVNRGVLEQRRFQLLQTSDYQQTQLTRMQEAKGEIDQIGPDIPLIGQTPGGSSGRAIQMRQQIGSLEIAELNDNHKNWRLRIYRHVWWGIKQFWKDETWFRIRDDEEKPGYRFVAMNKVTTKGGQVEEYVNQRDVPLEGALDNVYVDPRVVLPQVQKQIQQELQAAAQQIQQGAMAQIAQASGGDPQTAQAMMQAMQPQIQQALQQLQDPERIKQRALELLMELPEMQEPWTSNDVAKLDVDIVLDESPDVAIIQHEEAVELREMAQTLIASGSTTPDLQKQLMVLIVEASQLRDKKKILSLLEAPPPQPDPQVLQAQQMQQQMAQAIAQAEIQKTNSETALNQAKAQGEMADAAKVPSEVQVNQSQAAKNAADAGEKMAAE